MNSLLQSKNNNVLEYLSLSLSMFDRFDHVYLFGSILRVDVLPNDIDLLLVYSAFSPTLHDAIDLIKDRLEEELHSPIDLTVLSREELIETDILSRIGKYKQIK